MNEAIQRVIDEQAELQGRTSRLSALLSKPRPEFISENHWSLLQEQHGVMNRYLIILDLRLKDLGVTNV